MCRPVARREPNGRCDTVPRQQFCEYHLFVASILILVVVRLRPRETDCIPIVSETPKTTCSCLVSASSFLYFLLERERTSRREMVMFGKSAALMCLVVAAAGVLVIHASIERHSRCDWHVSVVPYGCCCCCRITKEKESSLLTDNTTEMTVEWRRLLLVWSFALSWSIVVLSMHQ